MAMDDSVVDFSASADSEQGRNPVQTGFVSRDALVVLQKSMAGWAERGRLDAVFLRALTHLTAREPEQAREGFTPIEIAEEIGGLLQKEWVALTDKDLVARKVRGRWKEAQALWNTKLLGLQQAALDGNLQSFLQIGRNEGGGSGKPTRYWMRPEPLEPLAVVAPPAEMPAGSATAGEAVYICEDVIEPNLLARVFAKGLIMQGLGRAMMVSILLLFTLVLIALGLLLMLGITGKYVLGLATLGPIVSYLVVFAAVWISGGALIRIGKTRIEAAPWWMQSWNDDRLLELRAPPRFPAKMIKAVHYSGRCPVCGGKLSAQSGGLRFWGRIVGRCEDAPIEHVFSFDHVTRRGHRLS